MEEQNKSGAGRRMDIQMIGIDHSNAPVEKREKFSFTKTRMREALAKLRELDGVNGCVMISTCNRMELYASMDGRYSVDLYGALCGIKQQNPEEYREYFVFRDGQDAVEHLFALASGMESRIVGEDQILMQVKDALSQAREADCTDKVMEVLFRKAVTAGKKVKTEIVFHKSNSSAIASAMEQLREQGYEFEGKRCLVIGNGEMGKLTAMALREQGADVTVTVRQYRSGVVQIPPGCSRINYGERYGYIPQCDLIVSATASPNLTLTRDELAKLEHGKPQLYLDLAVPRDIEPSVAGLPEVTLYDIDSFAVDRQSEELRQQLEQAAGMLREGVEEYVSWYECKDFIPKIQTIGEAAGKDVVWRTGQAFGKVEIDEGTRQTLEASIQTAAAKVVDKLLFALRDTGDVETLRACLEAFGQAYPEASV